MIFNSTDFLLFFAVFFAIYTTVPQSWKKYLILAGSYFFYGYWSVKYLCLLVFTMGLDFRLALCIDRSPDQKRRKFYLVASLVSNLGVLFVFKYLNLFSEMITALSGHSVPTLKLILPFGISFYTFHSMSYIIDVYRGVIAAEQDFTLFSGYVMFFPQLVAGPLARANHLLPQFTKEKHLRLDNLISGSYLIAKGYFLKVVIADTLGGFVDVYFRVDAIDQPVAIMQAVYFFAFQIYCDFSGYTLIARGIAKWLDFDLVENFRTPYFALSITDFWRRWHISLSTWLRDYLYISLGGNRKAKWKTYRNLMATMLLGGLWHGSNVTFVIWGCLHGFFLSVERAFSARTLGIWIKKFVPAWVRCVAVFHLVCLAWIFFRGTSVSEAIVLLRRWGFAWAHPLQAFQLSRWHPRLTAMVLFVVAFEWLEQKLDIHKRYCETAWPFRFAAMYAAMLAIALLAELNPRTFIYFQF